MKRGRPVPIMATSVVLALLLGGAISLAAFYVARYGPSGGNWSFRGNGALAVYTALPGVMLAGWTALILHARGSRHWLSFGMGAGLIGLALALLDAALLPVFGMWADQVAGPVALLALALWIPTALVLATQLRVGTAAGGGSIRLYSIAGGLWLAATLAGLVVVGIVVPAGS